MQFIIKVTVHHFISSVNCCLVNKLFSLHYGDYLALQQTTVVFIKPHRASCKNVYLVIELMRIWIET